MRKITKIMDRREFLKATAIALAGAAVGISTTVPLLPPPEALRTAEMSNTINTLNGLFKEVYANKIENLIPEGVRLETRRRLK
jgi:hypothetical protein